MARIQEGPANRTNYTCRGPDHNGVERTVPGYPDKDLSKDLAAKIHQLVCHKANSSAPPPWLREWVINLPPKIRNRLAEIGLHDASVLALPVHGRCIRVTPAHAVEARRDTSRRPSRA